VHTFEERYEWDQKKADTNLDKHGVDFVDATGAFGDPYSLILSDDHPDEERYAILGMDAIGRLVVVVYTWRGDLVRVISARKATTTEARLYASKKQ
jgi:uncharacterized protein